MCPEVSAQSGPIRILPDGAVDYSLEEHNNIIEGRFQTSVFGEILYGIQTIEEIEEDYSSSLSCSGGTKIAIGDIPISFSTGNFIDSPGNLPPSQDQSGQASPGGGLLSPWRALSPSTERSLASNSQNSSNPDDDDVNNDSAMVMPELSPFHSCAQSEIEFDVDGGARTPGGPARATMRRLRRNLANNLHLPATSATANFRATGNNMPMSAPQSYNASREMSRENSHPDLLQIMQRHSNQSFGEHSNNSLVTSEPSDHRIVPRNNHNSSRRNSFSFQTPQSNEPAPEAPAQAPAHSGENVPSERFGWAAQAQAQNNSIMLPELQIMDYPNPVPV